MKIKTQKSAEALLSISFFFSILLYFPYFYCIINGEHYDILKILGIIHLFLYCVVFLLIFTSYEESVTDSLGIAFIAVLPVGNLLLLGFVVFHVNKEEQKEFLLSFLNLFLFFTKIKYARIRTYNIDKFANFKVEDLSKHHDLVNRNLTEFNFCIRIKSEEELSLLYLILEEDELKEIEE